eukprot:TRINITY_DN1458_c0_g2_i1.p1 TRINITY_DN1458_c0_g2~~TRINITY_DN1458_c0_g2_i1.p1  ORF type:complete len:106 (+),score=4.11 TRINITY_DN1458_c0_g2_i1:138-455(+)
MERRGLERHEMSLPTRSSRQATVDEIPRSIASNGRRMLKKKVSSNTYLDVIFDYDERDDDLDEAEDGDGLDGGAAGETTADGGIVTRSGRAMRPPRWREPPPLWY